MKKIFEFVSTNVLSGLENVVINICTLINGYDFTYVSPNGPINAYLKEYHIPHISVYNINPYSVRKVIKRYHPDIVHGHDVKASLSLAINSHLCHSNCIKVISELHNDDPRMWRYGLRSILYAISTPCYDKIIMVSKATQMHFVFHKLIDNKCVVINNVINFYRILNDIKDNKINRKIWDCIFLGRLVNQKDPIRFVNIIHSLIIKNDKNIKAVMVGDGPLFNVVKRHIEELKLNNNIKMVGFKHNPFKYLQESKVLVMTSRYEGLSLVSLESLFLKTPIVGTYTSGLKQIKKQGCGYLAHSNENFINCINILLNNHRLYKRIMQDCRRCFNSINNINDFISKYTYVYKSLEV